MKAVSILSELSVHEELLAAPNVAIAVMQTAIINASMTAYSTAVGPDCSRKNFRANCFADRIIEWTCFLKQPIWLLLALRQFCVSEINLSSLKNRFLDVSHRENGQNIATAL